jgi:hypothetical protein
MRRQVAALLAGLLLTAIPAAHAETDGRDVAAYGRAVASLQLQDLRLQNAGWRLVTGNAPFCENTRPEIGLLLQDVMAFDTPEQVRRAAGIAGDIAVQAVAEGSPAADAGLAPNDEIVAIDAEPTALSVSGPGDHQRVDLLHQRIASGLAAHGAVTLRVRSGAAPLRDVRIEGVPACPSRFEVVTGRAVAQADGQRVQIGERYGSSAEPSAALADDEFVVIVAHELAHNLLRHAAMLDRIGRSWANVRMTEREADRLSVWLLSNAGIDPDVALRTTEGWRRRRDAGLLRAPTHEGWRDRREIIAREIARMRGWLAQHGRADWRQGFAPEILADDVR